MIEKQNNFSQHQHEHQHQLHDNNHDGDDDNDDVVGDNVNDDNLLNVCLPGYILRKCTTRTGWLADRPYVHGIVRSYSNNNDVVVVFHFFY